MKTPFTRRKFLKTSAVAAAAGGERAFVAFARSARGSHRQPPPRPSRRSRRSRSREPANRSSLPGAGLVSRRQVRHLGALGTAVRGRVWRLVRAANVYRGRAAIPAPPRALRPPFQDRFCGRHQVVESRQVRRGLPDGPLSKRPARSISSAWVSITTTSTCGTQSTNPVGTRWPAARRRTSSGCSRRRPDSRACVSASASTCRTVSAGLASAHGSDKTGPLAGVPYDGKDPQYAELYHDYSQMPADFVEKVVNAPARERSR